MATFTYLSLFFVFTQLVAFGMLAAYPSSIRPWHRQLLYYLTALVLPVPTSEALAARLKLIGPQWLRGCIVPCRVLAIAALYLGIRDWMAPLAAVGSILIYAVGGYIIGMPMVATMITNDRDKLLAA